MGPSRELGWQRVLRGASRPRRTSITAAIAFALTSGMLWSASAAAQTPAARPDNTVAVSEPPSGSAPENSPAATSAQPAASAPAPAATDRYRDGMVIWETPPDE